MTKIFVVGTGILLFVGLVGGAAIYLFGEEIFAPGLPSSGLADEQKITNFEDCVAAGNPVMESYPRQCNTPDGGHFMENIGNELEKADRIRVSSPRPNQTVSSPIHVAGEARGFWFFEASFPILVLDEDGSDLGVAIAQAQRDPEKNGAGWMSQDFVPFEAEVEFEIPSGAKGTLVFVKDNPSGLPENDDQLRMPIWFAQ